MFVKYEVHNEIVNVEFSSYADCIEFVKKYRNHYGFENAIKVSENVYDEECNLVYSGKIFEY